MDRMLSLDGRRSSIDLMSGILRLLRLGVVGKTEVMYTVRLSHYQTQNYLRHLGELGLVQQLTEDGRTPRYRITPKGLDLLGKIERLQEMLHVEETPHILDAPELKVDERSYGGTFRHTRDAV